MIVGPILEYRVSLSQIRDFTVLSLRREIVAQNFIIWVLDLNLNRDIWLPSFRIGRVIGNAIQKFTLYELTWYRETAIRTSDCLPGKPHSKT